jgi:hypothetical protein
VVKERGAVDNEVTDNQEGPSADGAGYDSQLVQSHRFSAG